MVNVDDYNEVKDCIYKDEHYSARDNGAVMRHPREGKRIRKDDNVWTFGKPNDKTGYRRLQAKEFIVLWRLLSLAIRRPTNMWLTTLILTDEITDQKILDGSQGWKTL